MLILPLPLYRPHFTASHFIVPHLLQDTPKINSVDVQCLWQIFIVTSCLLNTFNHRDFRIQYSIQQVLNNVFQPSVEGSDLTLFIIFVRSPSFFFAIRCTSLAHIARQTTNCDHQFTNCSPNHEQYPTIREPYSP